MRSDKNSKTSRDNVDCVVTEPWAGRPRNRGSIPERGKRSVPVPKRPGRFGGTPILLSNGYWELFPQ
jgi:hypothetical protein